MFALPALEASAFVGFIIPGEIGVILGGVLANQHKLPLWAALVAGIAGAIIGDSVGYEIGRRYGETILSKIPNRIRKQEHLDRAKDSVRRNGSEAVFVGRFTAALRGLVPGFSGMSHIPYAKSWRGTPPAEHCGPLRSCCSATPPAASTSASPAMRPCSASAC